MTYVLNFYFAGKTFPLTSPKPTLYSVFFRETSHNDGVVVFINFLSVPSESFSGFCPRQVNSSIEPKLFGSLPEIVPEAYKSPTSTLQPLMVWMRQLLRHIPVHVFVIAFADEVFFAVFWL